MSVDGTTRLSVEIDTETNEQLKTFLPWGTKTEVIRSLINLLISAQKSSSKYIAQDLIQGNCRLVVQSLNTTDQRDEEIRDLVAKVQYLVDLWPNELENNSFTFPDGDTWMQRK